MNKTFLIILSIILSAEAYSYCQVDTTYQFFYPNNGSIRQVNGRGISFYNADSTIAQEIYQSNSSGTLENASRSLYSYNGSKQVTELVTQSFITSSSTWRNSKRLVYNYTAGKLTEEIRSNWDGASWEPDYRNLYAYDGSGNLTIEGNEDWITATSSWRGVTRTTKTYSPNLSREITENYSPITLLWVNSKKVEYNRNGLNQITRSYTFEWKPSTSTWDTITRNNNSYSGIFVTAETEERKATPASSWSFFSKTFSRYNTSTFRLLERNYLEFDSPDNRWDSVSRTTYEYNVTSDLIAKDDFYAFDVSANRYTSRNRTENSCRQINVGVRDLEVFSFNVYPNPIYDNKITINTEKETDYSLFELTGKILQSEILQLGENNVQLPNLNPGVYLLKVGNSTQRLIKQ